jgi:SAM-dependent methyltransferase
MKRNLTILWDGNRIPLPGNVVDCALATEVFEHCSSPEIIMGETLRVLKPGGLLFFTVPFLWPLHDVRTMSIAIRRSFWSVTSGTQCLRRSSSKRWAGGMRAQPRRSDCGSFAASAILSRLVLPIVRYLARRDRLPGKFGEGFMITGLSGTAIKPLMKC